MAAAVGASGVMGIQRANETHPFFQSRAIPHRAAVSQHDIGDDVEKSSPPAESTHLNSRKRKSRPLAERPSNTHQPQLTINGSFIDAKSADSLVAESKMEKPNEKKMLKLNPNGKLLSSPHLVPVGLPSGDKVISTSPVAGNEHIKGRSTESIPESTSLIVKIGYAQEDSEQRLRVGNAIDEVLATTREIDRKIDRAGVSSTPKKKRSPERSTHPFFLGRVKPPASTADDEEVRKGEAQSSDASVSPAKGARGGPSPRAKQGWRDMISSSSRKNDQSSRASPAPWPTLDTQRVDDLPQNPTLQSAGPTLPLQKQKSKVHATPLPREEDVLCRASYAHAESLRQIDLCTARHPARTLLSGEEMVARLQDKLVVDKVHLATQRLKSSLTTTSTAFDQGRCDQYSWTVKSSPSRAGEVLQRGREAVMLRDWIKNLTVASAEATKGGKHPRRKRGRPRRSDDDDDDFIVPSGDEADELVEVDQSHREHSPCAKDLKRTVVRRGARTSKPDKSQTKNTILLSGPAGCGKTASVYAAARELDFEVFEIHPGTRRGARDILERVGDMTQNHLVQQTSGENSAEEVAATPIDEVVVRDEIASGKQRTVNGFLPKQVRPAPKVERKRKARQQDDQKAACNAKRPKKSHKQSLILIEEVDQVFEEDRAFWSGVMSLINQSRRPIILTCNDESGLPLDQLPLHGILRYSPAAEELATDYLVTLAASEGHELERDAVSYLYRSQKHDLRATITELDFWCQMGVGSRKGGLDWMLDRREASVKAGAEGMMPRVFSTNTYLRGMGLTMQQSDMDPEQLVLGAYQQLNMPVDTWCADADRAFADSTSIGEASTWADSYSDLDLCQRIPFDPDPSDPASFDPEPPDPDPSDLQLHIAISLTTRLSQRPPISTDIIEAYIREPRAPKLTPAAFLQAFEPLRNGKPTFPVAEGRLAPSLDAAVSTIITDLAPYIRSIVAHEQRWGANLPTTKRATRSSDKPASYFPKSNVQDVLLTGGEGWQDLWPRSHREQTHLMEDGG